MRHLGRDIGRFYIEAGFDYKSFAVGAVNDAEQAWSVWLGPFYVYIARS